MNKLYSFVAVMLISLVSLTANAFTFVINVDHPERLSFQCPYGDFSNLQPGANTIDMGDASEYTSLYITANSGFALKQVYNVGGGYDEWMQGNSSCTLYLCANEEYSVTTCTEDELRPASCTVYVDDASQVNLQRSGSYSLVTLQDGYNTVRFNPETETTFMIANKTYGRPLYQVKVGEEDARLSYNTYYVEVTEDCDVTILANFPDKNADVNFTFVNGDPGCVSQVTVDGEALTDFANGFTMKYGQRLYVSFNSDLFNITDVKVNDIKPSANYDGTYSSYETYASEEQYNITITATKLTPKIVYINIDDPANVTINTGYGTAPLNLVAGDNTVEVGPKIDGLNITANPDCTIESIKDENGNDLALSYGTLYFEPEQKIYITTSRLVRDKEFYVYATGLSKLSYMQFANSSYTDRTGSLDLTKDGEKQVVEYYAQELPFAFNAYSYDGYDCMVFLDGEEVSPMYYGSMNRSIDWDDCDTPHVLRIYVGTEEELEGTQFMVLFEIEKGLEDKFTVTHDEVVPVEIYDDYSKMYYCYATHGTVMHITPVGDEELYVGLNKTKIEAGADGRHAITLNTPGEDTEGWHTVTVTTKATNGIANVITDGETAPVARGIYNILGVKIADEATDEAVEALGAGLYIINGVKTYVK